MLTLKRAIAFVSDAVAQYRSLGLCAGKKTIFFSLPAIGQLSEPAIYIWAGQTRVPELVQLM